MAKKYPGYDPKNTFWDEHHRSRGEMTNNEFFTSNGKGGFYEGMVWDDEKEEWVLNIEEQRRQDQWEEDNRCSTCGYLKSVCNQECDAYQQRDSNEDDSW